MTQEELDALMSEDIDLEEELVIEEEAPKEALVEEESAEELDTLMSEDIDLEEELVIEEEVPKEALVEEESAVLESVDELDENQKETHFRVDATSSWPPPPTTSDHQVVNQLDDVTKDSEVKATEIFDKLENINNITMNIENASTEQIALLENNIDIFDRLSTKFTNVESFKIALEENKVALVKAQEIISEAQSASDEVMMTMDIMQYQDIHRQKIERVINVMRALSQYMSSLFDSNVSDGDRVGSAIHIDGDGTQEVVNEDDIEALIASFGKVGK